MIYRTEGGKWEMFDTSSNELIAVLSLASESMYPIGRHNWTLTESMCGIDRLDEIKLSLSICKNSEFTCSNGDCIPKEKRCDTKNDCVDFSDEEHCEMLLLARGYRSERPPSIASETVHLNTEVQILRFTDISDVRRVINMELIIETAWRDARPKYLNLQNALELNRLSRQDAGRLWRPEYKFPNVQNGDINILSDYICLRRISRPQPGDFNDVRMDTVYTGDAAILVRKQHMSGSFVCSFDVFYYPFDTQQCSLLVQGGLRQRGPSGLLLVSVASGVPGGTQLTHLRRQQVPVEGDDLEQQPDPLQRPSGDV
ncbi:uncharacterized protein [Panulirus ornatus]|uniref:uncharacterized protein n=1 Tax=Panulirus ornatus TaxID=150431 RepID=UPI003A88FF8F